MRKMMKTKKMMILMRMTRTQMNTRAEKVGKSQSRLPLRVLGSHQQCKS